MSETLRIGFCLSGSFCTFERAYTQIRHLLAAGHEVTPILSFNASSVDTRFGRADEWVDRLEQATGRSALTTLTAVEPIGPKGLFDVLVVAPCTGTTLGKLANGISDTPVTLAVKSHLRRSRPVVIAVSTNDALGGSFRSIALLKNIKCLYFVPMAQDDVVNKPNSLVADFTRLSDTVACALEGIQLQPLVFSV
ncbi:MAG: dipicolinate synthase subunit B [Clostridia bacterium]|nr:dipicolinate synthase subunit B [Clostridia bacterium]